MPSIEDAVVTKVSQGGAGGVVPAHPGWGQSQAYGLGAATGDFSPLTLSASSATARPLNEALLCRVNRKCSCVMRSEQSDERNRPLEPFFPSKNGK